MITDQPPPIPQPTTITSIQELVRVDLVNREQLGVERYGTPLQANNGRNSLIDAYQELLDLVCYLRQTIEEGGVVTRDGADDTPRNQYVELTPGQLLARILDSNAERRLDICTTALANSKTVSDCLGYDHKGRIAELERKVKELSQTLIRAASGLPIPPEVIVTARIESGRTDADG